MDIRTGKTYASKDEAISDGVPESDIAEISRELKNVKFSSGPFKDREYQRMPNGQLVRRK